MDPQILDQINAATLLIFVILAIGIVFRITSRYLRYKKEGLDIPQLLPRDLFLWVGLVFPFASVLLFRATGITPKESNWYPFWIIGSDLLALLAVAYWAYVEFFIIEKKD